MTRLVAVSVALSVLLACAADPGEGKVAAQVQDVEPAAPVVPAAPASAGLPVPAVSGTLATVDPARSSISALGAKVTAQHPIKFHSFEGKIGLEADQVVGVAFAVDMASLEADHPKLTTHLKAPDFFDVPTFPHATFRSTAVQPGSDAAGATHTVSGELTLRGTTKLVTFPATISVEADKVEASSEFVLNRKDFGIVYAGQADDLIQDNVALTIRFVASR